MITQNIKTEVEQNTAYRTGCFQTQIKNDNRMPDEPVNANGVVMNLVKNLKKKLMCEFISNL